MIIYDRRCREPDFPGKKIVAFLTNNATPNWGAEDRETIASRHPDVQIEFRKHAGQHPETLQLGKAIFLKSSEDADFRRAYCPRRMRAK